MPTATKKASAKILDMTNVKDSERRFNTKRLPEGDYLARVTKVEDSESKKDQSFQWLFTITLEKHPTASYPYYCKLQENQLWKIRNLLLAAGLNVPKKKLKLDPEKVVSKLIAVTLEDDEYEGKLKSVVAAVFPPSEMEGGSDDDEDDEDVDDEDTEDEEEEEEPAPKARKKKAPEPEEEEEDEEEEEEEEAPKAKKKKAKKQVTEDDLEELDIDEV